MGLIYSISQIQAVSTINVSNKLEAWQPYLDEAQLTFIEPVIGKELIDAVSEHAFGSGSGGSKYDALLTLIPKPLILYALYLGIDEMAVSISGSGVQVVQSDNHKMAPQYLLMNLKERWISRAHKNMDILLAYLDKNKADFSEYISMDSGLLIRSTDEFNDEIDIKGSRRVFLVLKPVIRNIQKKYIIPTISQELYEELVNDMQSSSGVSDDNKDLLNLIRPALAHLTMARALQEISLDILDWGIFATAENTFDNPIGKQVINKARIGIMLDACQADGDAELKALQEFLDKNASADKYEAYFTSDKYLPAEITPEARGNFKNNKDSGIFVA
jgi:hypothetical protein